MLNQHLQQDVHLFAIFFKRKSSSSFFPSIEFSIALFRFAMLHFLDLYLVCMQICFVFIECREKTNIPMEQIRFCKLEH